MPTADAVAREAAWLATSGINGTGADGLPSLPAQYGGPWQIVQAYWPRTPAVNKSGIYVLRPRLQAPRVAAQRIRPAYPMRLRLVWPVLAAGSPLLETSQQDFDNAVELLRQRVQGPLGDKSHGGRFESAAENPGRFDVDFLDPEQSMARHKSLRAEAMYSLDDFEISG